MTRTRILFDLKAALDGFAGIPQETRLLFRQLQDLGDRFRTDGMLQHEHEFLSPGPAPFGPELPAHERIDRASRTVVSFYSPPLGGRLHRYARKLRQYRRLLGLRRRALAGRSIALTDFEGNLFEDFLWTRLFDKSLGVDDKPAIATAGYRIAQPPRGLMQLAGLKGLTRFHSPRLLRLDTRGYDFFVAQTPFPGRVSEGTRLVVRYHDAVPILMPHTIGAMAFHQASHFRALKANVEDGAVFACNSQATRDDLVTIFPELQERALVINNVVADHFDIEQASSPEAAGRIIAARSLASAPGEPGKAAIPQRYLLMVSTLEPRKNHALLIEAWGRMCITGQRDLALVLVGSKGWDFEPIEAQMRPWMRQGKLFHLSGVPAHELGILYRNAAATICPSRSEGFDYSGIEALSCGGTVASSDIKVHREIYGDASAYFDPYSSADAAAVIARLIGADGDGQRKALRAAADHVLKRYRSDAILADWRRLFEQWAPPRRKTPA